MHKINYLIVLSLLLYCAVTNPVFGQVSRNFSFTLTSDATTSAGVYSNDGTLVKTLWSGIKYQVGTHTESWDGKNDEGKLAANGSYTVKLVSNNVHYTWEGVIGNTSTNTSGSARHYWTDRIWDMTIVGNKAYFAVGYAEGSPSQHTFNITTPNIPGELWSSSADLIGTGLCSRNVCSDGINVYWSGLDPYASSVTAVFATTVGTNAEVKFAKGQPYKAAIGRTYPSIIDKVVDSRSGYISGLAVQKTGKYLFSARAGLNSIHVLDKVTGALVRSLPIPSPRNMCIDKNDNLWIISSKNIIVKYKVNQDGTLSPPLLTLKGLIYPVAVSVTPDNKTVVIADGATSQQLKAFSNSTGSVSWTYGQAGGYTNSPNVADTKLCFKAAKRLNATTDNEEMSFVSFQSDGSFWIGDGGTQRTFRLKADRSVKLDEILNVGYHYSTYVDPNNPTRLFINYLEFAIDYSKPLAVGNGSWKLVKNWVGNVNPLKDDQYGRIKFPATLSNGRTYFMTRIPGAKYEIGELTTTGIRYTGVITPNLAYSLEATGDLRTITNTEIGQQTTWKKQALLGFDANNNPLYSTPTIVATVPPISEKDPVSNSGGMYRSQTTASGIIACFSEDSGTMLHGYIRGSGYHLGGVKDGKWVWKTSSSTTKQYRGPFPADGTYDIGNGVQYGGTYVSTIERSIFWGYNGEFWKSSQTNKWNHYWDNGLFIGQFGITGPETRGKAAPMLAGNAKSFSFVKVGSDYYLYHCDESQHSATHRWKISGLSSIQEYSLPLQPSMQLSNPVVTSGTNLLEDLIPNQRVVNGQGIWKIYPATQVDATEKWVVQTNTQNYGMTTKDINIYARSIAGRPPYTAERNLGTTRTLTGWQVSGKLTYPRRSFDAGKDAGYWGIKDAQGRLLVKINRRLITYPSSVRQYFNDQVLWDVNMATLDANAPNTTNFTLSADAAGLHFKLGDLPVVTAAPVDKLANWQQPRTLCFSFYSATNGEYELNLAELNFLASVNTTPLPPTLTADDIKNTLNASHSLGTSQILVSVDNAAFIPYTGQINVGNVTRAAGYWRFKVKAAEGRNESPIVESPKFNGVSVTSPLNHLPLKLSSFRVKAAAGQVNSSWSTDNDLGIKAFVVERSMNGYEFNAIDSVSAANSLGSHNYSFVDMKPLASTSYYRLKIVAADASHAYSSIDSIVAMPAEVTLYPDPAQNILQVQYPVSSGGHLEVFSVTGKKVRIHTLIAGSSNALIDVQDLPMGLYFLQYYNDSVRTTKSFIKQ
jgi:hypothetical protein